MWDKRRFLKANASTCDLRRFDRAKPSRILLATCIFVVVMFMCGPRQAVFVLDIPSTIHPPLRNCAYPNLAAVITTYLPERFPNLKIQTSKLLEHCFVKSVVIWNNNPSVTIKSFHRSLVVLNSEKNIGTTAKYESCVRSGFHACYIIDDDWMPQHLASLYSTFLANKGQSIVVLTDPITQHMDESYSFSDGRGTHFGFAWIGVGSIVSSRAARRFLEYETTLIPEKFRKHSDIFFSVFTNSYPLTVSAKITPLEGNDAKKKMSAAEGYQAFLQSARYTAFHIVQENPDLFANNWALKPHEFDARAICENGFIIIDSEAAVRNYALATSSLFNDVIQEPDAATQRVVCRNPPHSICDESSSTSYVPLGKLGVGRYFGYKFLEKMDVHGVELMVTGSFHLPASRYFNLELQGRSGEWKSASVRHKLSTSISNSPGGASAYIVMFFIHGEKSSGARVKLTKHIKGELSLHLLRVFADHPQSTDARRLADSEVRDQQGEQCEEETQLFVAVMTTAEAMTRRKTIRETLGFWTSRDPGIKLMFFLASESEHLKDEMNEFNDIVAFRFEESYDLLSEKTLQLFSWVSKWCSNSRYLMKIDDDSFVQFDVLIDKLNRLDPKDAEQLYMGHFFNHQEVYHSQKEKNYEPFFDGNVYPPYASGAGYVISMPLVRHLSSQHLDGAHRLRILRNEDAAVGLWLAGLNITRAHDDAFWPEPPTSCLPDFILLHRQPVESFLNLHRGKLAGDVCSEFK